MANQLRTSGVFNLGSLGGDAAASGDADFDSVVLLLDGDGTNGQTTFIDQSNASPTIAVNGNTQVFGPKYGTGSIKFDGTGDYLTGPTNTNFAFGSGDFTIESWVYFTGFDVFGNSIVDTRQSNGNVGILLEASAAISGQYYFRAYNPTSGHFITSSQALSTNTWYHVALVRNANNYKIFVDGVSTASVSNSVLLTGEDLTIGASFDYRNNSGTAQFTGYLDDLRITKGAALYSSNFTPPSSALTNTVSSGTVVLRLNGDGNSGDTTFIDQSSSSHTITTNGDVQVYGSKFGNGSIDLDGTGDYLEVDFESNIGVSGEAFTVECWVYFDTLNDDGVINLTQGGFGQGGNSLAIGYYTSQWRFYDDNTGTATGVTPGPSTGQWYHTAIVFDGTDLVFYIDGVARLIRSNHASNMPAGGYPTVIFGGYYGAGYELDGKIDDIRVTKGVARYTSNFTPPTSALPAESDTVFLVRGDNGGTDVSDEGNNLSATNMSTVSSTVYSSPQTVFDFNGSTSYLISSGNPYSNLDDGDPWTIEFWAKLDANAANTAYGMFGISDHTTGASGITIRYYNGWNWWVDGFNNQQTHQTTATTGTWYHIALVYNGSGTSRLFVDGVPSTNALGRTCVLGTEELTLGRSYEAYNGEYFNGQLADVRITKGVVRYPQRLPPISALPTTGTVAGATRPTRKWGGLVGRSLIVSELPHSPNAAIFRGTTNQGSQALSINGTAPTFSGSDRSRYHTPLYTGYYSYSPATAATSWTAFYDWEMNATNYPYLASYGTTAGAVRRFYTQGTDIRVYRGGGSTFPIMLSGLTDGQRYRAAFRWDGTNLKSYLVSGTAEITALPTASATTTEDFDLDGNTHSIGVNSANNVPAEDLGSPLYAYAFYNSALTDAQMVDVFNVLNGHVI